MSRTKKKSKKNVSDLRCPYCGAKVITMTAKDIYGEKAIHPERKMYVCANYENGCDAYVGSYKRTGLPLGSLANGTLRNERIRAHQAMNEVIDAGYMTNREIYAYLGDKFSVPEWRFHIGGASHYVCQETVRIMKNIMEERKELE